MPLINPYFAGQGHCLCDSTAAASTSSAPSNSSAAASPSMTAWAWFAGILVTLGLVIPGKRGRR